MSTVYCVIVPWIIRGGNWIEQRGQGFGLGSLNDSGAQVVPVPQVVPDFDCYLATI
jgi:hypothetical protein